MTQHEHNVGRDAQEWEAHMKKRVQELKQQRDELLAAISSALVVLNMLDIEIPKTMGEVNLNLLHSDILEARDVLAIAKAGVK